ncbi:hypothetical protein [Modestobacter sp. SSW1-42]|uniref:hypothetical protein n=1 Tax=Modestobacter sp. SSW1-42 TaxID=596372 RepID=UPI003985AED2
MYFVDWTPDWMGAFAECVAQALARLGVTPVAPPTGTGVAAPAASGLLVEVEATAVVG